MQGTPENREGQSKASDPGCAGFPVSLPSTQPSTTGVSVATQQGEKSKLRNSSYRVLRMGSTPENEGNTTIIVELA